MALATGTSGCNAGRNEILISACRMSIAAAPAVVVAVVAVVAAAAVDAAVWAIAQYGLACWPMITYAEVAAVVAAVVESLTSRTALLEAAAAEVPGTFDQVHCAGLYGRDMPAG